MNTSKKYLIICFVGMVLLANTQAVFALSMGGLSEKPVAQPDNLTFSNVKSYSYVAIFNHASPQPESYIVLRSIGQTVTGSPDDGVTYYVGDAIANARVVYIGSTPEFSPSWVVAGTTYFHSIFSFNGTSGNESYLTTNPLSGSVTTPPNMIDDYYDGINSNSENFIEALQNLIRPHNAFAYGSYTPVMINGFEARDTTGGQKVVYCVYTGYAYVYNEPFGWIGTPGGTLSREHTFPHSWFPTHPSTSGVEYSDFYNLFPVHQNNANNRRSNHPLGVVQTVTYQFLDGKLGRDSQNNIVYEPRDSHKGDAARALFYMLTRYHNSDGNEWYLPPQQNQDILKFWHFTDPPDAWEKARNDYIHSQQGNRNPFVDSIHFVAKIDFQTMQWMRVEQVKIQHFNACVYPNPFAGYTTVEVETFKPGQFSATIYSVKGIPVYSTERSLASGTTAIELNLKHLPTGAYIFRFVFDGKASAIKVVKL